MDTAKFGFSGTAITGSPIDGRVTYLENNEYKFAYFTTISAATGTITVPTQAEIMLDQFEGGIDAYVSTINGTQPSGEFPVTAGGITVDVASFDASGNYTLTGTPSSFPVALIYVLKIKGKYLQNLNLNNILPETSFSVYTKDQYRATSVNTVLSSSDGIIDCKASLVVTLPNFNTITDNNIRKIANSTTTDTVTIQTTGGQLLYDTTTFDLYPGQIDHREQNQRKSDITAVDIICYGGVECVEVTGSQSFANYFTNDAYTEGFFVVDTINGVPPTSIDDLKDKFLALL